MSSVEGWKTGRLGELCSIEIGGTPSRNSPEFWDTSKQTSNLWVSIKDLGNGVVTKTAEQITDLGVKRSNAKLQATGTVLLSFKLTIGRVGIAGVPLYTNEAIAGLRSDELDPNYLFQGLQQWDLLQGVDQAIKGATLNKEKLKRIEFEYPTYKPEQTKIAEVLSTVDRAIEQTEALIAKQQRIKTGLMQDLLTRGIDEHGNLRSEETHEFKDSPLGRIPVEWNIIKLSDVTTVKNGTTPSRGEPRYWTGGTIPWLPTGQVHDRLIHRANEHITDTARRIFSLDLLPQGTLLVAMIGQGLTRGKVAYLEISACINQNFAAILPCPSFDSKFLFHYLELNYERIRGSGRGSNQEGLNCSVVADLETVVPPLFEQRHIAKILDACDTRIRAEGAYRDKLKLQKKGLMQDLLTGEKRVTPLLEADDEQAAGSVS